MPWINIPNDVIVWFRSAFAEANRVVTETLLNVPNAREPSLDDTFIQALIPLSAPTLMASGAIVRMDIHNIGGLRRVARWEIADIGIVVFIIRAGKIIARKVALLQAKRLYPKNLAVDENDPVGFMYGFNALLRKDPSPASMALVRRFEFNRNNLYAALTAGSQQQRLIEQFVRSSGNTVDYLLYNPPAVPSSVHYPVVSRHVLNQAPPLGCRVVSLAAMMEVLSKLDKGRAPSLRQIENEAVDGGWRVEEWAADMLLTCKVGRPYDASEENVLLPIIERRTGPIGAAIAINIELPAD
jgi:hypothetical protein